MVRMREIQKFNVKIAFKVNHAEKEFVKKKKRQEKGREIKRKKKHSGKG